MRLIGQGGGYTDCEVKINGNFHDLPVQVQHVPRSAA
jgi:hypothetical protein